MVTSTTTTTTTTIYITNFALTKSGTTDMPGMFYSETQQDVKSTNRLSRMLKRMSLIKVTDDRTCSGRDSPIRFSGSDTVQEVEPIADGRFSFAFSRSSTRLSNYSSSTIKHPLGRETKVRKEAFIDNKVEIELDCINEDGIYRPGDTIQGQIKLKGSDNQGRFLRSVTVRMEGKAKIARYEVRANTMNDEVERVIRTREWLFYSAQKNLFQHKTRPLTLETKREGSTEPASSHSLAFSFDLPMKDLSAELNSSSMAHSSPSWRKPTCLPPTCLNEVTDTSSTVKSMKSNLKEFLRSFAKTAPSEIRYYLVVEVHWQRNSILRSNKVEIKVDFVVHPSPPSTASVNTNEETSRTHQGRSARSQSNATVASFTSGARPRSRLPSGNSGAPSYLSQRLSIQPSSAAVVSGRDSIPSSIIGRKSRDMTVIDTVTGPRGWYIEHCSHHLANGEEVLFEFSYPAMPCFLMDEEISFKLNVTFPTFLGNDIRLVVSDMQIKLLRSISSYSLVGKLEMESKKDIDVIEIVDLQRKDTTPAPTDEYSIQTVSTHQSRQSFTGKFKIRSGLEEAQEVLRSSRRLTFDASKQQQHKGTSQNTSIGHNITLPSFQFRGLSVDYTMAIAVFLIQIRETSRFTHVVEMLEVLDASVETSTIQIQSRSPPSNIPSDTAELQMRSSRRPSVPASPQSAGRASLPLNDGLSMMPSTPMSYMESPSHRRLSITSPVLEEQSSHDIMEGNIEPQSASPSRPDGSASEVSSRVSRTIHDTDGHVNLSSSLLSNASTSTQPKTGKEGIITLKQAESCQNTAPDDEEQAASDQTANEDTYTLENIEHIEENDMYGQQSIVHRERSSTLASHFSAQTLDGLPPPYASPDLTESRRLV